MKNVLIINEGYSNNLGDQAILDASERFYKDQGFATRFLYLSDPTTSSLPKYDFLNTAKPITAKHYEPGLIKSLLYFLYWYLRNRRIIVDTIRTTNFDYVHIGGGQLINSSHSNAINIFAISIFWFTKLIKRYSPHTKIYWVAVGVASSFNRVEKYLFSKSLERVEKVWVRDEYSKKQLLEIFNFSASLIPDIAFYNKLNATLEFSKSNIALVGIASYEEVVAKYDPSKTKPQYFNEIVNKVEDYNSQGYTVKLIYTSLLDAQSLPEFTAYVEQKNISTPAIANINNFEDLKTELQNAKIVFSGRMHALILGMKYGCKVEPYLLSQKLKSFEDKYLKSSISISELSEEIENGLKIISN